jgi:hypothetical protein
LGVKSFSIALHREAVLVMHVFSINKCNERIFGGMSWRSGWFEIFFYK